VLAAQTGVTMTEVVLSIESVTAIVGEISAANSEQANGVSQVGDAVTQMDHVTQQNAGLVVEMAAAAASLNAQANDLVNTVAVFKLSAVDSQGRNLTPVRVALRSTAPIKQAFQGTEKQISYAG
jgi:methyl-accepting chemotaxis protein